MCRRRHRHRHRRFCRCCGVVVAGCKHKHPRVPLGSRQQQHRRVCSYSG